MRVKIGKQEHFYIKFILTAALTVAVVIGVTMLFPIIVNAGLNEDFQAYNQIVTSVIGSLQNSSKEAVKSAIPDLLDKDEVLRQSIESCLLKVQAVMMKGNPYEGTESNLDETTTLVRDSAYSRRNGATYSILWVDAVEVNDPEKENIRQNAIDTLTNALSLTERTVQNFEPLLQYISALDALPPILVVSVPKELSFSSTSNVHLLATIRNEGDTPAEDVRLFVEYINDAGEISSQRVKLGVVPGKSEITHTFYLHIPEDTTSITVTTRVEASNSFGNFAVSTLNFVNP